MRHRRSHSIARSGSFPPPPSGGGGKPTFVWRVGNLNTGKCAAEVPASCAPSLDDELKMKLDLLSDDQPVFHRRFRNTARCDRRTPPIIRITRKHVDVEVWNCLICQSAVVLEDVDAYRSKGLCESSGDPYNALHDECCIVLAQVQDSW
jgi:hypothetical protein